MARAFSVCSRLSSRGYVMIGKEMTIAEPKTDERMPVWSALSELFLDTELRKEDHDRIAAVLAASPYSVEKIEEILRFEVTPVLRANLLCVAGEWVGFDDDWLREKIAPRMDRRPFFPFGVSPLVRKHWHVIKVTVAALRTK